MSKGNVPLCQLEVMIPAVRDSTEAVPLCDNIQEDKQRFFDTDVGGDGRCNVCENPVGEFEEGLLIHVRKADEAFGNSEHERHGPPGARSLYAVHFPTKILDLGVES